MGSGLRFDTDTADGTLEVDTDYIRSLTFAEGQVEFLRDIGNVNDCLLYTSPSPRDRTRSRMPSSA